MEESLDRNSRLTTKERLELVQRLLKEGSQVAKNLRIASDLVENEIAFLKLEKSKKKQEIKKAEQDLKSKVDAEKNLLENYQGPIKIVGGVEVKDLSYISRTYYQANLKEAAKNVRAARDNVSKLTDEIKPIDVKIKELEAIKVKLGSIGIPKNEAEKSKAQQLLDEVKNKTTQRDVSTERLTFIRLGLGKAEDKDVFIDTVNNKDYYTQAIEASRLQSRELKGLAGFSSKEEESAYREREALEKSAYREGAAVEKRYALQPDRLKNVLLEKPSSDSDPRKKVLNKIGGDAETVATTPQRSNNRLYISICDEDDGYDTAKKEQDWVEWLAKRKNTDYFILLRPGGYSIATPSSGWDGFSTEVARNTDGDFSNYSQVLSQFFKVLPSRVTIAVDNSGSMTINTVQTDINNFKSYLRSLNISFTVSLKYDEEWIAYHL